MLQLFHQVMPKDPMQLYAELNRLLNTRTRNANVKKGFTNVELGIMLPTSGQTDASLFDISLINKIILACRSNNFIVAGKSFTTPTGVQFDANNLPLLQHTNSGDHAQLITKLRNHILHSPPGAITEQEFEKLWKFIMDLFVAMQYPPGDLEQLKTGSIVSAKYLTGLTKYWSAYGWFGPAELAI